MIFLGIKKLLASSKGVVTLLVLICTFALAAAGKIDSTAIVALSGLAQAIFCFTRSWQRINNDNKG